MREARGPAWTDWLHDQGVVALTGVDTRSLVLHLRQAGAMRAIAMGGEASVDEALTAVRSQPEMSGRALAAKVSTRDPFVFSDAGWARIAVVDYGCKRSILNRLAWSGAAVTVYPHDVDADELVDYDGVLLSNGPGDPEPLTDEQATIRAADRARPDPRHLPRPPAARARDRAQDVQAPVRPPRREPSGARARDERRSRHVAEPRLRGLADAVARGDAHLALRRHRRGPGAAQRAGAVGAVPSGGRPRAARRLGNPRVVGRGGERPCQGGVTSSRSA